MCKKSVALEGSHTEFLILNGTLLSNINSVSFSYDVEEIPASFAGNSFAGTMINGPTSVTSTVEKFLLNKDIITGLASQSNIQGQFEYGDNYLAFNQAVLQNYTVDATIGEIPVISFDFSIYGDMSGVYQSLRNSATDDNDIKEVQPQNFQISFDKELFTEPISPSGSSPPQPTFNSVQSFSFSEQYNYSIEYGLNGNKPQDIVLVNPADQEISLVLEIEKYQFENVYSFLDSTKDRSRNISMSILDEDSNVVNKFQLQNGHLVGESFDATPRDTIQANLIYRGYRKI